MTTEMTAALRALCTRLLPACRAWRWAQNYEMPSGLKKWTLNSSDRPDRACSLQPMLPSWLSEQEMRDNPVLAYIEAVPPDVVLRLLDVYDAASAWDGAGAVTAMHVLTCGACRWCLEAQKLARAQLDAATALREALGPMTEATP